MTNRYSANIPTSTTPIFPQLCVVCGKQCEQIGIIYGNPPIRYFGGWQWLLGGAKRLNVYGHQSCIKKLNAQLMSRSIILFAALVPALLIDPFNLNPFIIWPLILFFGAGIFSYQIKKPVKFEFTQCSDIISFEFENESVAKEFSKLNKIQLK